MNLKNIIFSLLLLIIASLCGWFATKYYFAQNAENKPEQVETKPTVEIQPDGRHAIVVKIFIPSQNGIQETEKKIFTNYLPINIAEEVMKEYLQNLKQGLKNTRLLGIYRDRNNIIYIDLSDDFRRYFSDSAAFEYYLMESLLKTILINVPGTEDVKLIVEGKELESIGGHFNCLYTLKQTSYF